MAGPFERGEAIQRTLLVGGVALDRVDNDDRVQVVEHSRPPRGGSAARGVQFLISLAVVALLRVVF